MISLRSLPVAKSQLLVPLIILTLSVVAYLLDNIISEIFIYNRTEIGQGQIWRLFTGHLFHTNGAHLLLNLSAITLLWALHGQFYTKSNYLSLLLLSALATSVGLYFFSPELHRYVGLSGVLHGVFVWGAVMDIRHKDKTGYLLFIGVWLKVAYEQLYGASGDIAKLIGANVAIDAHLWGAVGGLIYSIIYLLKQRHGINGQAAH